MKILLVIFVAVSLLGEETSKKAPELTSDQIRRLANAQLQVERDDKAFITKFAMFKQQVEQLNKEFEAESPKMQEKTKKSRADLEALKATILKELKCEKCEIGEDLTVKVK